jgi:hypothetical protein
MFYHKELKKFIASLVMIAFVFQVNVFLHSQREDEIVRQFRVAKDSYKKGDFDNARTRIQRIIAIIVERQVEMREILRQCYMLLGAIYEREKKPDLAEENYRKAREISGIKLVDEVDLENLPIFRKIIKRESSEKGVITKPGEKKKKRFPWLVVAGGVLVLGVVVYFLFLKPKKKYQLTVEVGDGVEGFPDTGTYEYKKGKKVNYSYRAEAGFSNPKVLLDGYEAPLSGTIKMDRDHILKANVLVFETDRDTVAIAEGSIAAFLVNLSAQPPNDVEVTVDRVDGDPDINVTEGKHLTFTPSDWESGKTVVLAARQDDDSDNDQATIEISAQGIPSKRITVTEQENYDNNPPQVRILNLSDGETVSGVEDIQVDASDDHGLSKAELYIDDVVEDTKELAGDTAAQYTHRWNTMGFSNGVHTIRAVAYDTDDKTGSSPTITVNVHNVDEPPTVSIDNPSNGETVSAKVLIKVDAFDEKGIDRVEFYIDGEPKGSDNTEPYEYIWNTTEYTNATHFIKVIAYDTANQFSVQEITVTVDNR